MMGGKAAELIDVDDPSQPRLTHSLCLTELRRYYNRRDGEFAHDLPFLLQRATVIEGLSKECAITAGRVRNRFEPLVRRVMTRRADLSTVDCILLAVSLHHGFRVVTCDRPLGVLGNPDAHGLVTEDLELMVEGMGLKDVSEFVYQLS